MIKSTAVSMISLAESLRCSPRLLATSADIETFSAKNRASPKSLGCVVSPTAAWYPAVLGSILLVLHDGYRHCALPESDTEPAA